MIRQRCAGRVNDAVCVNAAFLGERLLQRRVAIETWPAQFQVGERYRQLGERVMNQAAGRQVEARRGLGLGPFDVRRSFDSLSVAHYVSRARENRSECPQARSPSLSRYRADS